MLSQKRQCIGTGRSAIVSFEDKVEQEPRPNTLTALHPLAGTVNNKQQVNNLSSTAKPDK